MSKPFIGRIIAIPDDDPDTVYILDHVTGRINEDGCLEIAIGSAPPAPFPLLPEALFAKHS
jgi:hypothetical protein